MKICVFTDKSPINNVVIDYEWNSDRGNLCSSNFLVLNVGFVTKLVLLTALYQEHKKITSYN